MSSPNAQRFAASLGDGEIIFEVGQLAGQAGGAVVVRAGESMLLTTATAGKEPREGIDFFPLSVEFEERLYAAGRIPGSFFRREGRPSEEAVLSARLIDRPLRPLFNQQVRNEVQVIVTVLSSDTEHQLDILGINGASAALMISDIPWEGPIGAVRIGLVDEELVVNPPISVMANSRLDLRVAGTADAILMVEAGANEVTERRILEALRLAHDSIQDVIRVQHEMVAAVGKAKRQFTAEEVPAETREAVQAWLGNKLVSILEQESSKEERSAAVDALRTELVAAFADNEQIDPRHVDKVFGDLFKKTVRNRILNQGIRPDGRDATTIRPIWGQVGILPRVHGSGLFTRGETQVLTITTLGTPRDEQTLDTLSPQETKRYMHHYNFPPFSVGETGRIGSPRRREIGHGALAERALLPMIPPEADFPYVLRLVSEVVSSNGSTSMASVCGSTLSLMDAGVPLKAPVAGVAMGLISEEGRFVTLTDIQGLEDALGDMDFKVAGTREGITALQMDIKIKGLPWEVLDQALAQAREGRLFILDRMNEIISEPRATLSRYAPSITTIQIDPDKIGKVIGPGGKVVRAIQEETGVKIDIKDDGTVYIAATDQASAQAAHERIEALVEEAQVGKIYTGRVVRIADFGAFVEILPGIDGLVPVSQLADYHVPSVEDVVKVGDEIMVMVTDIDREGKIRLSRQAVLEGWTAEEARSRDNFGKRSDSRRGGRDRRGGGRDRRSGGGRPRR